MDEDITRTLFLAEIMAQIAAGAKQQIIILPDDKTTVSFGPMPGDGAPVTLRTEHS